ncbi:MAG: hypothetical protein F6K17_26715 [Okeania sp. SIO3C4]|nr:hypothetical protein [Okeania sp. SIO3C4]
MLPDLILRLKSLLQTSDRSCQNQQGLRGDRFFYCEDVRRAIAERFTPKNNLISR